ncbi:adenylate/guanylate cyclase domain-containing protein [Tomitella gaofuii]|uniref:adenylate/guanylate cyclase domain-containing protein n=1 Tax=Tomitella gaofuii TaxID=2760083 RepID=UPI0015FE275B|nr:adenylate/guanylate cyclase domain-containing protein [Tomitella gaofuii]
MVLAPSTRPRAVLPALIVGTTASNLAGAVFLYLLMRYALSPAVNDFAARRLPQFLGVITVSAVLLIAGTLWIIWPVVRWQRAAPAAAPGAGSTGGHAPPGVRRRVIRVPIAQAMLVGALWVVCGLPVVWQGANISAGMGSVVTLAVLLGGVASAALTYFEAERFLRPATTALLDGTILAQVFTPGVRQRILTAWLLGTGLPVLGVLMVAADVGLADDVGRPADIRPAVVTLAAAGLVLGAFTTWLAAGAVGDPIRALQHGMQQVRRGDLTAQVTVYDTTELGELQMGFNGMVAGLAERRRLRELFGRFVGEDVARQALERGTDLGGEEHEVAVLFVDLVGSTTITDRSGPKEVVRMLNAFFDAVIRVVDAHGGFVNKFQGDATLAVFGAPIDHGDSCTAALAAARELRPILTDIVGRTGMGIGVSAGTAVAGHVGGADRMEYTVIGTPVNEAARLTELAKNEPTRTLASSTVWDAASADEQARWCAGHAVLLRGRTATTRLMRPVP